MAGCRPLSEQEIYAVLAVMRRRRDRAMFVLGVRTGFRISELLSLNVSDVYKSGRVLGRVKVFKRHIKDKKESREIPLHSHAAEVLAEYMPTLETGTTVLFPSARGTRLTRFSAHKIFKDAFAAAGLKGNLATHSMRKTFAKKVYDALGRDLVATRDALGHSHISTTVEYLAPNKDMIDQAILK